MSLDSRKNENKSMTDILHKNKEREGDCMYTIGQVSKMTGLPVSTLRYYDQVGFFPDLERVSGIRQSSPAELETLQVIECLKKSGLDIKSIRQFLTWCKEGKSTYDKRLNLFETQRKAVEAEMAKLQQTLDMIDYKCWYYQTAEKMGSEEEVKAMIPDRLPPDIRAKYDNSHLDCCQDDQEAGC